jgi:ribose transport system ATP-binding protein
MENISKRFPGVLALDNVSFSLKEQSVHALIGQNGAGKSTLINVLMGSYPKDEGRIHLDGREVDISSTADALNLGLASIYQEMSVVPDVSVAENIFLGDIPVRGALRKVDYERMYRRSRAIFEEMGVELDVKRHVRGLGVAEQQLIMIARALQRESRILVMDEPTASLDSLEIENLFRIIRNLIAAGRSTIYISHYIDEVFEIADEVTILRNGKKVVSGSVSEFDRKRVIEHMLGYKETGKQLSPNENIGPVVLEVKHLSSKPRLKDISFTLREGEIVGLAGLLGSGRTELVRAIFGADKKSSGEIRVDGELVSIRSPTDAVRLGMGLLTEERFQGIIPQFSVKHNITLPNLKSVSNPVKIDAEREEQIAQKYVQMLKIQLASVMQKITSLSGGNQQKVILAKWLNSDVKILLLDEPTKGIDVGAKAETLDMILDLADQGLAVVLISSELDDLVHLCNRVLVMKRGRIVKELSEVSSDSFLQAEVSI